MEYIGLYLIIAGCGIILYTIYGFYAAIRSMRQARLSIAQYQRDYENMCQRVLSVVDPNAPPVWANADQKRFVEQSRKYKV